MQNFWSIVWIVVWSFLFIAYLMIFFRIITDLFSDHEVSGWVKAIWIIALIFVPFLTALIYLITRGKGMAERQMGRMRRDAVPAGRLHPRRCGKSGGASPRPTASPTRRRCSTTAPSPRPSSTSSRPRPSPDGAPVRARVDLACGRASVGAQADPRSDRARAHRSSAWDGAARLGTAIGSHVCSIRDGTPGSMTPNWRPPLTATDRWSSSRVRAPGRPGR